MRSLTYACAAALLLPGTGGLARAQTTGGAELYHVQFVKAAPGKLGALIDAYAKMPADKNNPETPILLRHAQGDDWQLIMISPLGTDETVVAQEQDAAMNQWAQQARGLSARHGDTFTQGRPWSEVKPMFAADGQTGGVYVVTTYEPVPGHREALLELLQKPAPNASGRLILQHREGAPWQILTVTRYASWTAFGEGMQQERARQPGVPGTAEHIASHHDTLAERVTAPVR